MSIDIPISVVSGLARSCMYCAQPQYYYPECYCVVAFVYFVARICLLSSVNLGRRWPRWWCEGGVIVGIRVFWSLHLNI